MVEYVWPDLKNRARPKATFELNIYLVPTRPERVSRSDGVKLVEWLTARGIVGAPFDRGLGWLAPGPFSHLLFSPSAGERPAFEYLIVHNGEEQFVPNAHTGRFGARCSHCGDWLDDELHAFLRNPGEVGVDGEGLVCSCGMSTPIRTLGCEIDTAVTPFFVNLCHVDSAQLCPETQLAIEAVLGSPVRVLRERL